MPTRFDAIAVPALCSLCGLLLWHRVQPAVVEHAPLRLEVRRTAHHSIAGPAHRPLLVEVTGKDSIWGVRYAGTDGRLHTGDDVLAGRLLALPANSEVTLKLCSSDYLYGFSAPPLGLREIAVPELPRTLHFQSGEPLTLPLPHEPMCGGPSTRNKNMGRLEVMREPQFAHWIQTRRDHGKTH